MTCCSFPPHEGRSGAPRNPNLESLRLHGGMRFRLLLGTTVPETWEPGLRSGLRSEGHVDSLSRSTPQHALLLCLLPTCLSAHALTPENDHLWNGPKGPTRASWSVGSRKGGPLGLASSDPKTHEMCPEHLMNKRYNMLATFCRDSLQNKRVASSQNASNLLQEC